MAERGCGHRIKGGVYATTRLSRNGKPVEHFLIDPPIPIDMARAGLSSVGVSLHEQNGQSYVLDYIGSEYYPNVADVVEETRRLGLSRRISSSFDFSALQGKPFIVLVHKRAYNTRSAEAYTYLSNRAELAERWFCPKEHQEHLDEVQARQTRSVVRDLDPCDPMCARLWWYDLDPNTTEDPGSHQSMVTTHRPMPGYRYYGHILPLQIPRSYKTAMFAAFPIHALEVIRDPDTGKHERAYENASRSGLKVRLEDE